VQRAEFVARYSTETTGAGFVDKIYATTNLTPGAERNAAIAAFGSGDAAGRAAALRIIADSQQLRDREFRTAFVLMQYFGYLRRSPDEAPNTGDFGGFDFWLNKLNTHNGNYISAEMVRSFLVSDEYRSRF
jgi:hypothetical protein